MMRELILSKIKEQIDGGDDEIVEQFGDFTKISHLSEEDLLNVYSFMVGFRG